MENHRYEIFKNLTVLFVDDDHTIGLAMEHMLKMRFQNVWLASNGADGLNSFVRNRPDIVITDIHMPIMNGLELVREIKKIDPKEPVVIITGFEDELHKAQLADAVLIKPIQRDSLFGILLELALKHYNDKFS